MHIYPPTLAYYSYFNASIGFNLDALIAGIIPNTIPINIEKIKDIITTSKLTTKLIPANFDTNLNRYPTKTPSIPPNVVRSIASIKNCLSISKSVAPMAFLSVRHKINKTLTRFLSLIIML